MQTYRRGAELFIAESGRENEGEGEGSGGKRATWHLFLADATARCTAAKLVRFAAPLHDEATSSR
jgi:hypothetical protein